MIPVGLAKECFYLPEGSFVPHWRMRPASHFRSELEAEAFNRRHAGRPAGTVRSDGRRRILFKCCGESFRVYGYHVVWMLVRGAAPMARLDHIDGNCGNDAIENLREATQSQNIANAKMFAHNTSGVRGVSWRKERRKYRAHIKVRGKYRHLGYFDDLAEAKAAYAAAAYQHFGEYARVS